MDGGILFFYPHLSLHKYWKKKNDIVERLNLMTQEYD